MLPNKDYNIDAIINGSPLRVLFRMFLSGNIKFLLPKPVIIRFNRAEWLAEARELVKLYIEETRHENNIK